MLALLIIQPLCNERCANPGNRITGRITVFVRIRCTGRRLLAIAVKTIDGDDHVFACPHRRYSYNDDQTTVSDVVLRHSAAITTDEEGLFRLGAHQRSGVPLVQEEVLDSAPNLVP